MRKAREFDREYIKTFYQDEARPYMIKDGSVGALSFTTYTEAVALESLRFEGKLTVQISTLLMLLQIDGFEILDIKQMHLADTDRGLFSGKAVPMLTTILYRAEVEN